MPNFVALARRAAEMRPVGRKARPASVRTTVFGAALALGRGFSGGAVALELPPLKEPRYNDIERPERCDGNAEGWMEWSRTFRGFLRFREPLCLAFLDV